VRVATELAGMVSGS